MTAFLKKNLAFLLAVVLCLGLTACGGNSDDLDSPVVGNDWRVTGVVRDSGTITRDGEDTDVLVCVYAQNANFYYDTADYVLFDAVSYPIAIESDAWEAFQGIGFADLNGDGNSDVTMNFNDGGRELLMVWFWDTESELFMYQPDESQLGEEESWGDWVPDVDETGLYEGLWLSEVTDQYDYLQIDAAGSWQLYFEGDVLDEGYLSYDPERDTTFVYSTMDGFLDGCRIDLEGDRIYIDVCGYFDYLDGRGGQWQGAGGSNWDDEPRFEDLVDETGLYEGLWLSEVTDQYDYLQIDADGNWQLYSEGDVLDEGYLWYDPERDTTFLYSTIDGFLDGCRIDLDGDRIYIDVCGYFDYLDGRGGQWQGAGGSNWDDEPREDFELYHRDISEFEGVWYYEEDLSADTYIIIDGYGNWHYYQRVPGDPEGTEMDYGTFSYSETEGCTYYADSAMYDGVSYMVLEFDDGVLIWDDYVYYRME